MMIMRLDHEKMNIGLVGAGFMGKAHMVAFSNMPKLLQMHHLSLYLKQYATLFLKSQRISKKDMDLKKHVQTGWILSMILKSIL